MSYYSKQDILDMDRIKRLNLINSVSGIKPANLIGSVSADGYMNLSIFSSVVHLGSNPALLGFFLRPDKKVRRHTFENIQETGCYTINHIHRSFIERAHYTSAKFDKEVSEFLRCGLTAEILYDFSAPFVAESNLKMGMKFEQAVPITVNGTTLIIGSIEHLTVPDSAADRLDLGLMDNVGISGLNSYYQLTKIAEFPYARVDQVPFFTTQDHEKS